MYPKEKGKNHVEFSSVVPGDCAHRSRTRVWRCCRDGGFSGPDSVCGLPGPVRRFAHFRTPPYAVLVITSDTEKKQAPRTEGLTDSSGLIFVGDRRFSCRLPQWMPLLNQ